MATAVDSVVQLERFPVDLDLSEEFLKKNDNGPKETPENRAEKLQELLRLINDTPDLVTRTDETFLLRFLRAKYFHVEYAFQLLKNYEEFKIKNPDWMNVNKSSLKQLTCNGVVQVLPARDQNDCRIFYLQAALWKPSQCSAESMLQAGGLCGDATIVEPMTQVAGIVMIFNLKDVGLAQLRGLSASFAKRMVYVLANCLPVRINAIHIINEPAIFSMIFAIFKAFLTERMKKRIHFHGYNMTSLHQHIDSSCLPPELGGTNSEVNPSEWHKVLTSEMVMKELKALGYNFTDDEEK